MQLISVFKINYRVNKQNTYAWINATPTSNTTIATNQISSAQPQKQLFVNNLPDKSGNYRQYKCTAVISIGH